jgi:hypothetical protein
VIAAAVAAAASPRDSFAQAAPGSVMTRIECLFDKHRFAANLHDNASARDFQSMLPLELTIEDYADNEKIARLPRKLTERDSGAFGNEAPGDLCYYAPWGNLAFFYAGYRYSQGLIRLGRMEGGVASLLTRGKFPLFIRVLT